MVASLKRVALGILFGVLLGVPAGLALGMSHGFRQAVTPLSIGDAPVVSLLVFAAVWPILLNTAAGVAAMDPNWLRPPKSLSATRTEIIVQVVLPGVVTHVLTDKLGPASITRALKLLCEEPRR